MSAKKSVLILSLIFLVSGICGKAFARPIYVNANAIGANNGTSWANAYTSLQSTLSAAADGNEIWVAAGTYKPTTGYDRTVSFVMRQGVAIYGGFAGTETNRDERNWVTNQTILSGDIGTPGGNSDNSYNVVVGTSGATLDGFTITGGNANGSNYSETYGGGMRNDNSSPTVANCTFNQNSADYYGGGMGNEYSSPTVTNCTFSNNSATYCGGMGNEFNSNPIVTNCTFTGNSASGGGGMGNEYSSPTVTNCTFTGNSANDSGGGMYNDSDSNTIVTNCTFNNNTATNNGGGMDNERNSNSTVVGCTFTENTASSGGGMANYESSPAVEGCTFTENPASSSGGGMDNYESSPTVINCTFSGNSAVASGGMGNEEYSYPTVTNCTFSGNSAVAGGGMGNDYSNPTIINCTFSGNSASSGGGINSYYGMTLVNNSILWGNSTSQITYFPRGVIRFRNSDIQGGYAGMGDINADPLFISNPGLPGSGYYGDLRLQPGSPCIDAGSNSYVPADILDLDGDGNTTEPIPFDLEGSPRIRDGNGNGWAGVDMGAFENNERVEMPTFEPDGGGFRTDLQVVISCPTPGATIYYTTNGLDPTEEDPNVESGGSVLVTVEPTTTLMARAFKVDCLPSEVKTEVYYLSVTIYVNTTGSDDSNGLSWETARQTVQAAIDAARADDEVWVAAGTYVENITLKDGVALYGGFAGNETELSQRNWNANETILDGNQRGSVVTSPSEAQKTTWIDGFTIRNGLADSGGGMSNRWYCRPTVTNCTFIGNSAGNGGGMINTLYSDTVVVTKCTFIGNTAENDGGGMYNAGSSPTMTNCTFIGNTANNNGGGMWNYFYYNDPTVTNCTFSGNSANDGGGMFTTFYSNPTVTNCVLWGNTALINPQIGGDFPTTVTYSDVQGVWAGTGNIDKDPCFADANNGDYHLKSQAGRWDPNSQGWVYDDVTSSCIDGGNPNSDWTAELWPNGKRINMGAYGGTPEASMSLSGIGSIANLDNDPCDIVDFKDLSILTSRDWLKEGIPTAGDLNRDAIVNLVDYAIFANRFLEDSTP